MGDNYDIPIMKLPIIFEPSEKVPDIGKSHPQFEETHLLSEESIKALRDFVCKVMEEKRLLLESITFEWMDCTSCGDSEREMKLGNLIWWWNEIPPINNQPEEEEGNEERSKKENQE